MQIDPLAQGFGARVSGFDLEAGRSAEDVAGLRAAYDAHHLLVFRGQHRLAPERQIEISEWFGRIGATDGGEGKPWTLLDNDEASGRKPLPFHSDISFTDTPIAGISLHALVIPAGGTSTTYISNAGGWDRLAPDLRDAMGGRAARHFYDSSAMMDFDWPVFETWHPAVRPHPRTGRNLLFVTEHHTDRVEGYDEAEGAGLLEQAFAALYDPMFRYEHQWQAGDLLIWDNIAVQHARTREALPSAGKRVLQRVGLGEVSFMVLLERARQQARERALS